MRIDVYQSFLRGDIRINYMLNQDTLKSDTHTLKCDIIDAENALKLYKSDTPYFYKPDYITEEVFGGQAYYKIVFRIPTNFTIPEDLEFKFTEYCFRNEWSLTWNDTLKKWEGNNCQGRLNGKVIHKLDKRCPKNKLNSAGCYVMIKNDECTRDIIPSHEQGLMYSLYINGKAEIKIVYKNGNIIDGSEKELSCEVFGCKNEFSYEGYDVMKVYLRADNHLNNTLYMQTIDKIYLDMYVPGSSEPTRLTFKIVPEYHKAIAYSEAYIDLIGEFDTIERPRVNWAASHINENSTDIELYLRKTMTCTHLAY